jgi:hypothetical protein
VPYFPSRFDVSLPSTDASKSSNSSKLDSGKEYQAMLKLNVQDTRQRLEVEYVSLAEAAWQQIVNVKLLQNRKLFLEQSE